MDESQLDMRSVTDLITEDANDKFQDLNCYVKDEQDIAYAKQLCKALSLADLTSTGLHGGFCAIYNPSVEGNTFGNIAVKVVTLSEQNQDLTFESSLFRISEGDVKEILEDKNLFFSEVHPFASKKEDLSTEELELAYLANEHKMYQKLYGDFVLPSLFLCYKSRNKNFKEGEIVTVMVQNYAKDVKYIGDNDKGEKFADWKSFNEKEIHNLEYFANVLETVFEKTGYFPDELMFNNRNVGIIPDGRVVLFDTNLIRQVEYEHERKLLKEIGFGVYDNIKELRDGIAEWKKAHSESSEKRMD